MKKALAVIMVIAITFTLGITAFAQSNGFVPSPTPEKGPELVDFHNEDENCTAGIVVTPFVDKDKLSLEKTKALELAFDHINGFVESESYDALMKELSEQYDIPVKNLAIRDLFDISYYACEKHSQHGYFWIKLKTGTIENFVAMIHLNGDNWEHIDSAQFTEDGEYLTFKVNELSPFAFVVEKPDEAASDDVFSLLWLFILIAVTIIVIIIVIIVKKKKKQG